MTYRIWYSYFYWKNNVIAEICLKDLVQRYGKYSILSNSGTWYPKSCDFPNVEQNFKFQIWVKQYRKTNTLNDRTGGFDEYIPCRKCSVSILSRFSYFNHKFHSHLLDEKS